MDCQISKSLVFTDGIAVSILLVAQKLAVFFFMVAIGQLLPSPIQAYSLEEGESIDFISNNRPMSVETGLVKNIHSLEVTVDQSVQITTEDSIKYYPGFF